MVLDEDFENQIIKQIKLKSKMINKRSRSELRPTKLSSLTPHI